MASVFGYDSSFVPTDSINPVRNSQPFGELNAEQLQPTGEPLDFTDPFTVGVLSQQGFGAGSALEQMAKALSPQLSGAIDSVAREATPRPGQIGNALVLGSRKRDPRLAGEVNRVLTAQGMGMEDVFKQAAQSLSNDPRADTVAGTTRRSLNEAFRLLSSDLDKYNLL